jgi:TonB family protein
MRATIPVVALLLVCSVLSVPDAQSQAPKIPPSSANSNFRPAELVTAEEIYYPFASVAYGPVILDALVNAKGEVEDVVATRPIGSLSEPSIRSIRTWKFKPATLDDKPAASRVTIAVMFNPYSFLPIMLPPRAPDHELPKIDTDFEPPEIVSVAPGTLPNAAGGGAVVLQAKINASGELEYASIVRNFPPFAPNALEALQKWQFTPAKFNGLPITSTMPVAFVFRMPPVNPY